LVDLRRAFEAFANSRNAPLLEPAPQTLVVHLVGGPRGWRPLLGMRDPFLLVVRLFARGAIADGLLVTTALEHHGAKLPESVFEQHSRVLLDELARDVQLRKIAAVPLRVDERRPYQGNVVVVPRGGAMRNLRLRCSGIDVSRRGVGLVSPVPLDLGLVMVNLSGSKNPREARLVRCRKRSGDGNYELGLLLPEPLPDEVVDGSKIADIPLTPSAPVAGEGVG
jgi:hypothetical protein